MRKKSIESNFEKSFLRKTTILFLLVTMLALLAGCQSADEQNQGQDNGEKQTQTADRPEDQDNLDPDAAAAAIDANRPDTVQKKPDQASNPGISALNADKNWNAASLYIQALGKPVREISKTYGNWAFESEWEGGLFYTDAAANISYIISADDNTGGPLQGDEICMGIIGQLSQFFPHGKWPAAAPETEAYLQSYLGIGFTMEEEDQGTYHSTLADESLWISIYSEGGIVGPDSYIQIIAK